MTDWWSSSVEEKKVVKMDLLFAILCNSNACDSHLGCVKGMCHVVTLANRYSIKMVLEVLKHDSLDVKILAFSHQ
jgi:hypothetical protein